MLDKISKAMDAALDDALNARGRSALHVASGLALCAGAMLASAVVSYGAGPSEANPKARRALKSLEKPDFQPSMKTFSAVWPPMLLLLSVSGLRVWNAEPGPARTRALGFWGAIQGLHALSMLWGVKQQTAQLATNLATMAAGLAYANEAKKVDPPAATIVAPSVSWMAFANLITEELWRRNIHRKDVH
jgi:tryptophan-rich sensory protein